MQNVKRVKSWRLSLQRNLRKTVFICEILVEKRAQKSYRLHLNLKYTILLFFLCINVGYNNTVESQVATTFPQPPIFQNTQSFQVKSPYLDPVVSNQLIDNTCRADIDNVVLQHYCIPTKFKRQKFVNGRYKIFFKIT